MDVLLVTNAYLKGASFAHLTHALMDAGVRQHVRAVHYTNAELLTSMPDSLPRHAIFWDKDIRLAQLLEMQGLRLYNSAQAIADCDDKTLTYLRLLQHSIPMPETLLCPMTFPGVGYTDFSFVEHAAQRLGLPMVIKEGYGSFGEQVYLAHTIAEAQDILARIGAKPALFQRFVSEAHGQDIRVYVVDGVAIAAIKRSGPAGSFRSNVAGGGSAAPHTLTAEQQSLALCACKALGLDFGGVDLLLSKDGPLVCEVNSNAHFKALQEITGVNPADHILRMVRKAAL